MVAWAPSIAPSLQDGVPLSAFRKTAKGALNVQSAHPCSKVTVFFSVGMTLVFSKRNVERPRTCTRSRHNTRHTAS